jgi:hypothetical protein
MTNSMEPAAFVPERSAASAVWRWRLLDSAGAEVAPGGSMPDGSPRFASQSDAESWVGETWRELVEEGVDAVTLLEGDREVYGPMSLQA